MHIALIIGSYLLGSIPFSAIIPRLFGYDVFKHGSGNPGFTNVVRTCGIKLGVVCLLIDMLKGFLPYMAAKWLSLDETIMILAGFAGIIGHCYSIFLKFKGGKGVAASGGFLLAQDWVITVCILLIMLIILLITKYMSLASIIGSICYPIAVWIRLGTKPLPYAIALGIFLIYKHRANIKRLIDGKENKFLFKKDDRQNS